MQRCRVLPSLVGVTPGTLDLDPFLRMGELQPHVASGAFHASRTMRRASMHLLSDYQPRRVLGTLEERRIGVAHQAGGRILREREIRPQDWDTNDESKDRSENRPHQTSRWTSISTATALTNLVFHGEDGRSLKMS